MDKSASIFISHSSKDKQLAEAVCNYLESKGILCWIAPRNINLKAGKEYAESIIEGIEEAKIILLLFTKNANDSRFVQNEVERAFHYKKIILPFRIDDILPARKLELFLGSVHWLDASNGKPEDYFNEIFENCYSLTREDNSHFNASSLISVEEKVETAPTNYQAPNNLNSSKIDSATNQVHSDKEEQNNFTSIPVEQSQSPSSNKSVIDQKLINDQFSESPHSENKHGNLSTFEFDRKVNNQFITTEIQNTKDVSLGKWIDKNLSKVITVSLAAIVVIMISYFLSRSRAPHDTSINTSQLQHSDTANNNLQTEDTQLSKGSLDEYGDWIEDKGESIKLILDNGFEIESSKGSLEDKMVSFIKDPNASPGLNTWFIFNDLKFKIGKSTLKYSSEQQLRNLIAILKAYSNVKIKLGAYTDNSGDSLLKIKLSESRAKTVYDYLINEGIPNTSFDNIPYEGYGSQFPIADNSTPEGRAQNRRFALKISFK